jgi:imidazolonepropionase
MYDTLWIDADLATMVPGGEPYGAVRDGAVAVRDGRIAWVGAASALDGPPETLALEVRSAGGRWMTPGLVDCHTHAVFGGNRAREFEARLGGESYESLARRGGGILSTVRETRRASEEELTRSAADRLRDLAACGVTTAEVKSGYGLTLEAELKMLRAAHAAGRMAGVDVAGTLLALHAVPPEFREERAGYVALATEEILPAAVEEGLVTAADAFLEGIAFEAGEVEQHFMRAREFGLTLGGSAERADANAVPGQPGAAFRFRPPGPPEFADGAARFPPASRTAPRGAPHPTPPGPPGPRAPGRRGPRAPRPWPHFS